jgi:hypothetical protein
VKEDRVEKAVEVELVTQVNISSVLLDFKIKNKKQICKFYNETTTKFLKKIHNFLSPTLN